MRYKHYVLITISFFDIDDKVMDTVDDFVDGLDVTDLIISIDLFKEW
jgi:hypothetical protein